MVPQRNQLAHIYWDRNQSPWFTYAYDASGNMVKRQDQLAGVNDLIDAPSQYYDALNRPTIWENSKAGDAWFAQSHYQYDKAGREVATWRDEQSTREERFDYLSDGQLKTARYNASQAWTGRPVNEILKVDYAYTPDGLNRQRVFNALYS